MDNFNNLIVKLLVIQNIANDIHYLCHGAAFYGKHIFVDKIKFRKDIDKIKEVCLLGNEIRPLQNKEYLKMAILELPMLEEKDDKRNFEILWDKINDALVVINGNKTLGIVGLKDLTKGEENLIGGIAEKLQQFKGLISLQLED